MSFANKASQSSKHEKGMRIPESMKKLVILFALIFLLTVNISFALPNPAAVYCKQLGYTYNIVKTSAGEYGECIFPDKSKCDGWNFFKGKCGNQYSYCVKNGYNIKTVSESKYGYTSEYAICVPKIYGQKEFKVAETVNMQGYYKSINKPVVSTQTTSKTSLLTEFDWRNVNGKNYMTSVKTQRCGDCWAFATIGALEAKIKIAKNDPASNPDYSEQDLVSCGVPAGVVPEYGGCSGADNYQALDYVKTTGVADELHFPYTGTDEPCSDKLSGWIDKAMKISSFFNFETFSRDDIENALINKGPLVAVMDVYEDFLYYSGGIYRHTTDSYVGDHGIVIVGYNNTGNYWIAKNSWGNSWGENGYFRIAMGDSGIDSIEIESLDGPISALGITILSPINNGNYSKSYIPLNFLINQPTTWIGYSLDGRPNITITAPINLSNYSVNPYPISDGSHRLTVYAKDSSRKEYSSSVNFYFCGGDISGTIVGVPDGRVDLKDTAFVSKYFASRCGNTNPSAPKYNASADINDDCKVDMKDTGYVGKYNGKTCPAKTTMY